MVIIPLDTQLALICIAFCLVFELSRIVIAFLLARRSNEIRLLQEEKLELAREVGSIKSVQLEFVRHSLLTRKEIKIGQKIETLEAQYMPRYLLVKKYARIVRVVVYVAFSVYYWNNVVAIIDPKILWPFMAFSSRQTIGISVWVLVAISGLAWRHVFRSITVVLLRGTDFP